MSEKKGLKKVQERFHNNQDFAEDENAGDGTRNRFDFSEYLRRRNDKVKDLRLRENRRRKWRGRAA